MPRSRSGFRALVWSACALSLAGTVERAWGAPAQQIVPPNSNSSDRFGRSAAMQGDLMAIGALEGGQVFTRGLVRLYTWTGSEWQQEGQMLGGSDSMPGDGFAGSLALDDGTIVVGADLHNGVGGTDSGAAYVFVNNGGFWSEQAKLEPSDSTVQANFGDAVAIDGDTIVVGADFDQQIGPSAGAAYVFTRSGSVWTQIAKLTPAVDDTLAQFGSAVAIDGDTLAVGAYRGREAGGSLPGTVYMYTRIGGVWIYDATLQASDWIDSAFFGASVAVQGDTLLVGATNDNGGVAGSGSVYVFSRIGGVWTEAAKLTQIDGASGDLFGSAVAFDVDTAIIGSPGDNRSGVNDLGSAAVFVGSGSNWSQINTLGEAGDALAAFGTAVAISGDRMVVGMPERDSPAMNQGAAYAYVRKRVAYNDPLTALLASDPTLNKNMGWSVAIDGDTALIGAPSDGDNGASAGAAYVFRWLGNGWHQETKLLASDGAAVDFFGQAVALRGDTALVGAPFDDNTAATDSGSVYVFRRGSLGLWSQVFKIRADDRATSDFFGGAVALDGDTAIIGADGDDNFRGSAYVFVRSGAMWAQQAKLTAADGVANDFFGDAVAVSGDTVVVGAFNDDDAGSASGAAYVFARTGVSWSLQAKLVDSQGATEDYFGSAVAVSGDTALIGAYGADLTGVESGVVVEFTRSGSVWTEQSHLQALDTAGGDLFGVSIALAGDTAVVGSPGDDVAGADRGSAYMFVRQAGVWTQQKRLLPPPGAGVDLYGFDIAFSGENVLIGAPLLDDGVEDSGGAYLYERTGPTWIASSQKRYSPTPAPNDTFGLAVAIDADTAVVGAPAAPSASGDGRMFVLTRQGGEWVISQVLDGGSAVGVSGDLAVSGSPVSDDLLPDGGKAVIYQRTGGAWATLATVFGNVAVAQAGAQFGHAVSVSGDYVVMGAPFSDVGANTDQGRAFVYQLVPGAPPTMQLMATLSASDGHAFQRFGRTAAIDGETIVIGAPSDNQAGAEAGAAYVFSLIGGVWQQTAKLFALEDSADDQFGRGVAVSGGTILVGAALDDTLGTNAGAAYVYRDNGFGWSLEGKLLAPDGAFGDLFGRSVGVWGDTAVVACVNDDFGSTMEQGSAYVFRRAGEHWVFVKRITAPVGASLDLFANAVAISGETILVGEPFDDDQGGNAGAAHFFATNLAMSGVATVRNVTGGFTDPTFQSAVGSAVFNNELSAAYAAFHATFDVNYAGKALFVESAAEIRQPWPTPWTLSNTSTLSTPPGRETILHGSLTIPAGAGVTITTDALRMGASSTLIGGAGAVLTIDGDFDVAISDPARFDFSDGTIVVTGDSTIEAMSGGGGGGGARAITDFTVKDLTVMNGASATVVDNHDNDADDADPESIVVTNLVIESGATLNTNGRTVFYENLTNDGSVDNEDNLVDLSPCPTDFSGDNMTDGADLAILLAAWGTASPTADVTGDGNVDGADLAVLLASWGACP